MLKVYGYAFLVIYMLYLVTLVLIYNVWTLSFWLIYNILIEGIQIYKKGDAWSKSLSEYFESPWNFLDLLRILLMGFNIYFEVTESDSSARNQAVALLMFISFTGILSPL